eukprot:m.78665 g.78665  ORF g.78665 m.78665 type:complete len:91 (+) comp12542_c0_seq1:850-1122(+)
MLSKSLLLSKQQFANTKRMVVKLLQYVPKLAHTHMHTHTLCCRDLVISSCYDASSFNPMTPKSIVGCISHRAAVAVFANIACVDTVCVLF